MRKGDRAKGIIAKPMPTYWHTLRDCKINDDDDDSEVRRKEFLHRISAYRKPYFMTYVYPGLKRENDTYVKNNNLGAIRRFNEYGIRSIDDLLRYEPKTDEMKEYIDYYYKLMPVGTNACVVNRISALFEKAFKSCVSSISKRMRESGKYEFDPAILKSGVVYSRANYNMIHALYMDYLKRIEEYQRKIRNEKVDKDSEQIQKSILHEYFISECYRICSNEDELCDILIDICYSKESSKQFAWDVCGNVIVRNLLERNGGVIHYPAVVDDGGEFEYCGRQFEMRELEVE